MGKILSNFLLILFGIVCCSIVSSYISLQLGFPFGVPELSALLFFPFYSKDFFNFFKYSLKSVFPIFLLFFIFLGLSFLFASNYIVESLSTARSLLLLMLFFSYGYNVQSIDTYKLFLIAIGGVLGSFIFSFLNYDVFGTYTFNNSLAFAIFVTYPLMKRKYVLFIGCVVVAIVIAFFSGLRRQVVEILIVVFFGIWGILYRDKHKILLKAFAAFSGLVIAIYLTIPIMAKYFKNTNYYLYSKIFVRTNDFLDEGIKSEGTRSRHLPNLMNYMVDTIIPKGFYPRNISFRVGSSGGATFDFPLYEIFYTLGSVVTLFLLIFIVNKIIKGYRRIKNKPTQNFYTILYIAPCIMVLFSMFFDGGFMQHNFITPFTGLVFGLLIRKKTIQFN